MSDKQLLIAERTELAPLVADRFVSLALVTLEEKAEFRVVLTGGNLGIETLQAIADHPDSASVDWSRVRLWWGDERFVPSGDPDRNEHQANEVFLSRLPLVAENVYRVPAANGMTLDEAADRYRTLVQSQADPGEDWPRFDLAFAGMGPDAHVLSVFPDTTEARATQPDVLPVRHSPKPPAERVTMTIPLVNRAKQVWVVAAGAEKSKALQHALAGPLTPEAPVAQLHGREDTVIFIDHELADATPEEALEAYRAD